MKQKILIVYGLALLACLVIAQTECAGGPPVDEIVTVADATMHAGINLEYRETDLGGLVTRIWDSGGAFDIADDFCVFVNDVWISHEVAVEEVFSGDIIEWWVWKSPEYLVTSFVVE